MGDPAAHRGSRGREVFSRPMNLDELLAPLSPQEFARRFCDQAVVIRGAREKFLPLGVDRVAFEAAVAKGSPAQLKAGGVDGAGIHRERPLLPGELSRAYAEGWTIGYTRMDAAFPALAETA